MLIVTVVVLAIVRFFIMLVIKAYSGPCLSRCDKPSFVLPVIVFYLQPCL